MKVYLDEHLAEHRRGRFFASQLNAVDAGNAPPDDGLLLMIGKDFQTSDEATKEAWWQWCESPGRTLLLLPPFEPGALCRHLDWKLAFRTDAPEASTVPLVNKMLDEVSFEIKGQAGEFDRTLGHQWPDYSINTRYLKQHSATGVFSATCLPLWSIALLDAADALQQWLESLHQHAGKAPSDTADKTSEAGAQQLAPQDYSLLVCMYAWQTSNLDRLSAAMHSQPIPVVSLPEEEVADIATRLGTYGYLSDSGLSEQGVTALQSSPYWGYAEGLKEELA
jgi:hypothetical protein